MGPGVRQPAPHVAVVGPVGPGGKGGWQTAHIEPCVKAPRVRRRVLPRADQSAAHLGFRFGARRRLQGQPVVGLPGEARPLPGLTGEEELTPGQRLVGQEGLSGVGHLGRDKRVPGGPLGLSFQEQPQRQQAAGLLGPRTLIRTRWPGRNPSLRACPAVRSYVRSVGFLSFRSLRLLGFDFPPLHSLLHILRALALPRPCLELVLLSLRILRGGGGGGVGDGVRGSAHYRATRIEGRAFSGECSPGALLSRT